MSLTVPTLDPDTDTLTAALAYAAAGWYVGPLQSGSKHPGSLLHGKWETKTSRDREVIVSWFAGTGHGLFLHCGRSGAVVFDVDDPQKMPSVLAQAIIDTAAPHQSTRDNCPGRGHYVFAQPPERRIGNGNGRLGKTWGEVRGTNGVIVAFPSPHELVAEGGRYQWMQTGTVPTLPAEVAELLSDSGAEIDAAVRAFLQTHTGKAKPGLLKHILERFSSETEQGASRHQTAIELACWAFKEARAGYYPSRAAMEGLEKLFLAAVAVDGRGKQGKARGPGMAASEWAGISAYAVSAAEAEDIAAFTARTQARLGGSEPSPPPAKAISLDECHAVFRRWLGADYDLDALDAVLCAAACERLTGDPLWLLVISGSGNAKTETVAALRGIGAVIVSTISSDAALLSGTPKHERSRNATGGLLRKVGPRGVLVVKDVTSILSTDRHVRGAILAALREVHDGRWTRDVGTEGGLTLVWEGRLVVIGAVTTAWDQAHDVVATMGDRFVLVRMDSASGRNTARRQAIRNTGSETTMRAELAAAAGGVLAGLDAEADLALTEGEAERIGEAADLVTLARTAVIYDYRGDVVDAHAPEMPTRFAKQLAQIARAGLGLGMHRARAVRLALRCARDSMPAIRLAIIDDIAAHPHSTPQEIRRRVDKPRTTVDRQCQALHMLGVLTVDEVEYGSQGKVRWHYLLADGIDPSTLTVPDHDWSATRKVAQICEYLPLAPREEGTETTESGTTPFSPTHIAGQLGSAATTTPTPTCDKPCDHCRAVAETRIDTRGARYCRTCAPWLWKETAA